MNVKQKAAGAAVTVAAMAGVATSTAFESPLDLVPEALEELNLDFEDGTVAQGSEQKGPFAKLRIWVMGLPSAVRMLVAVPLWIFGWVLISAVSVFWSGAAPVLAGLLNWACLALVLLGVFTVAAKAAFPDVSVRRILRFHNVVLLLGLSAVFWVADLALPTVWSDYNLVSRTVWRVGATCVLAFICCAELKHQGKRAVKFVRKELPQRTEVELEAYRLADTVCPPREIQKIT